MPFIYSDEDQKLIDESLKRIKEFESMKVGRSLTLGLSQEKAAREYLDSRERAELLKAHAELVMTRIPVGFK